MTIMIIFMAVGPLAHGYLAFKLNATQTLVAEEETHDEKPKTKSDIKQDFFSSMWFHQHSTADGLKSSHHRYLIFLSKGYAGIPIRPPEMI